MKYSSNAKAMKDIQNLKDTDRLHRQSRKVYEKGTIKLLSAQGDRLYASVQRHPTTETDSSGVIKTIPGKYFGNEPGYKDVTLSELLIETDIDLSSSSSENQHWIGKEVTVEMVNSYPQKVYIQAPASTARLIRSVELQIARLQSTENELNDEAAAFLEGRGYSDEEIKATFEERLDSLEGSKMLEYGVAHWQGVASLTSDSQDMSASAEAGIVTELPLASASTSDGFCFKPNKALTAK